MKKFIALMISGLLIFNGMGIVAHAEEELTNTNDHEKETDEELRNNNAGEQPTDYENIENNTETVVVEENADTAERQNGPLDGNAYAVFTDTNELVFFRSTADYENNSSGTFKDINGTSYKGTVYSSIETLNAASETEVPWCSNRLSIKTVKAADGQIIRPASMSYWFFECSYIENFDFEGFDTSNVTSMEKLFFDCLWLTKLDLSCFDTGDVTDMSDMFSFCSYLTSLNINSFDTGNVTDMSGMFFDCSALTDLNITGFDTGNVTNMKQMFSGCSKLESLDFRSFNTSNVTDMSGMFSGCAEIESLDLSSFDTGNVTDMTGMFDGCQKMTSLDLGSFNTSKVISMQKMFNLCESMKNFDLSGFNTGNVEDMSGMFSSCTSLEKLDFNDYSSFTTKSVKNMHYMFGTCWSLKELDISSFDTENVTDMSAMFAGCSDLKSLDVTGLDTGNVTDMSGMFNECSSLTSLDVGGFDTSKVVNMKSMFGGNEKLTDLNLSGFDTSLVDDMTNMFYRCTYLKSLDISSFDTGQMPEMDRMFLCCDSLKIVILGKHFSVWNSSATLPEGMWINKAIDISLTEKELCSKYPANCKTYAGEWCKVIQFDDVSDPGAYYYDAVYWAAENDITQGNSPTTFNPGGICKRYQFVLFLWRQAGKPEPSMTEDPFTDVKSDPNKDVYEKAVLWAVENEITTGTTPTTFEPYAPLSRGQVVTFLYRAKDEPEVETTENPFKDVDNNKYYYEPVLWAAENNITTGLKPDQFAPTKTCIRGQTVTFMYRLFK